MVGAIFSFKLTRLIDFQMSLAVLLASSLDKSAKWRKNERLSVNAVSLNFKKRLTYQDSKSRFSAST